MQSPSDIELLREYARDGSEAAFGEIVRRYADFVYSAALRQVSDPELARDVAQLVFVDLARKAGSLPPQTLLIGWLCRGARLAALDQLRRQQRRLQRERLAMELTAPTAEPSRDWSEADTTVPGPKSLLVFLTPSRVQAVDRLVRIVNRVTTTPQAPPKAN